MKCKLSEKCDFGNLCKDATRHDSLTVLGCSSFKTKKPLTNEEWFCNLDTEDKAREISDMTAQGYWSEELVEEWLKQPHTPKE